MNKYDRISEIQKEMRSIVDAAKSEKRKLTDKEMSKVKALNEEKRSLTTPKNKTINKNTMNKQFSLFRAINNQINGRQQDATDLEYMNKVRERAKEDGINLDGQIVISTRDLNGILQAGTEFSASTYNGGKETVATEILPLKAQIENWTCLGELPCEVYSNLKGNVQLPVISRANVSWEDENSDADNAGITFRKVTLQPRRLAAEAPISRQLLIQSSSDIEAAVINQLTKAVAQKFEAEIFGETSGSHISMSGLAMGATAVEASAFTYTYLVDNLESEVGDKNYEGQFVTNAKGKGLLKTTDKFSGAGNPIWSDGQIDDEPTFLSNNMPKTVGAASGKPITYGDFSQMVIGTWGSDYLSINVDATSAAVAKKNEVVVTVNAFVDANVVDTDAFKTILVKN